MSKPFNLVLYVFGLVAFAYFVRSGDMQIHSFHWGYATNLLIIGVVLSFGMAYVNTHPKNQGPESQLTKPREKFWDQLIRGLIMTALWIYLGATNV